LLVAKPCLFALLLEDRTIRHLGSLLEALLVNSWDVNGKGWRLYSASALLLLFVHTVLLFAARHSHVMPLISDVLQMVLAVVVGAAAWHAAKQSSPFAKMFWRLQGAGFFIWAFAQGLATIYESILHRPVNQPWPSDILFFLWITPAFLSLFLDPFVDSVKIEWQQWLDFAQVGIVVTSLYIFAFEVPAGANGWPVSIEQMALAVEYGRNILLVACFAFRAYGTRSAEARDLYARMAIFFALFGIAEGPFLYLQVFASLRPGTLWDLPWTFAFAAGAVLVSWPNGKLLEEKPAEIVKALPARALTAPKLIPLFFPLAVLLMAAHIATRQFWLAAAAVFASFACSALRIYLVEEKQRESAVKLEERNTLLKAVFEGAGDAIYVKDLEGRYLIGNNVALRFLGKDLEEIGGKKTGDLFEAAVARKIEESDRQIFASNLPQSFELQLSRDGRFRTYLLWRNVFRDAHGKVLGIITVARDMTEYRVMEERLRQSQKMEAIGTLAGGVAHDFNNILMVISGYSSVLTEALNGDPKLRTHVEQIQKASERAAALTRQLLAFSRKQTIQPVPLSLSSVVNGIEKLLHRLIGENITIKTQLASDIGAVLADAGQIEQVILNLAVNARDAMPDGGQLTIETRNTVLDGGKSIGQQDVRPGHYVELIVSDTGTGMETAVQSHIFEPFFTTKPAGRGTGLGLSTVYGIIQQANGYVGFTSAPGAGTAFRICLPRIDSKQNVEAAEDDAQLALRGAETVLLVEDDASVCELVRSVLTSHGYSVLATRHPSEAETICQKYGTRIDLLLTDVIMPEMSGAELSKRLMGFHSGLRVLFMSGYIDDSLVRQGVNQKEVAFLQKPFSPQNLAKKVREVLDAARVS
jgi:PAS domain S-box-containing protein